MEPAPDRDVLASDVFCPRCGYNLRGLPGPRCPECGLTFPPEQWASGVLREHLPTWLDRCDPWQPHQVLVRSLFELLRGAWRPRWVLTKLDLNGPLTPAVLMLVCGTLWLYVIATVLIAAATMLHTGASPYASLKSAGLWWGPRVVLVAVACAIATLACMTLDARDTIGVTALTARRLLRLSAHWIPGVGLLTVTPLVLLLPIPEVMLFTPGLCVLLAVGPTIGPAIYRASIGYAARRRVFPWAVLGIAYALLVLCAGGGGWLASRLLPRSLDPPLWVYP